MTTAMVTAAAAGNVGSSADNVGDVGDVGNSDIGNIGGIGNASGDVGSADTGDDDGLGELGKLIMGQEPGSPSGDDPNQGASGEGTPTSTKVKPPPYDQDPKWKAARAAERTLQSIMEEHGFANEAELREALDGGLSLKQLIGQRDAKALVDAAEKLQRYEAYWAEQEALKKEQQETPEQTIARLKQEKKALQDSQQRRVDDEKAAKESQDAVSFYNSEAERVAGIIVPDRQNPAFELMTLMLGKDNPVLDVDVTDRVGVRRAMKAVAGKFHKFISGIKQSAIDEYVAGKSDIRPVTAGGASSTTPGSTVVTRRNLKPDASMEEVFGAAKEELLELIMQQAE